jgi:hypothetical protein
MLLVPFAGLNGHDLVLKPANWFVGILTQSGLCLSGHDRS